MMKWLSAGLMLIALAACGRGSDDTISDFFHDIDHGDEAGAVALFSPELQKKFDLQELHAAVDHWARDMQAHGGLKDIDMKGGVVTYNEMALYDVTLTYGDGTRKQLQTSLVHADGGWYINAAL
jgi:hypothetical protein